MKIAMIGYGKMGRMIVEIANDTGVEVLAIIDKSWEGTSYGTLTPEALKGVDVVIDFSSAKEILERIEIVLTAGVPMVIGTTGWEKEEAAAKEIVKRTNGAVIASSNFSLGVNIFFKIVKYAASLFSTLTSYDVALFEHHHNQKSDHPSGTAHTLSNILLDHLKQKKSTVTALTPGPIDKDALQIASLRSGSHPGHHEVIFDGVDDTITLSHTARTRRDFAKGALLAAQWIIGKNGWYTAEDLLP